jgi:hypothetical protein
MPIIISASTFLAIVSMCAIYIYNLRKCVGRVPALLKVSKEVRI